MIAVDTSALVEIVVSGRYGDDCMRALAVEPEIIISAASVTEALIVANGRGVLAQMEALIDRLQLDVCPVTADTARRAADSYRRWGRGFHPAGLNFGDCFVYEVAASHGGRLLFVGNDFARTDLTQVLSHP